MSTLIVGDGNFSFACALLRVGKLPHAPCKLVATSYDTKEVLITKYGEHAAKNVRELEGCGCRVMCGVDATNLAASFPPEYTFDAIIFQHPLLDANDRREKAYAGEMSAKEDYIIANRLLVLDFLLSAQHFLTEPEGEIKVTVKDVHPYTLWRVANLAHYAKPLILKRTEAFLNDDYPGYETMNVETDKCFPSESATTYIFGSAKSLQGLEPIDSTEISQIPRGKGDICEKMRIYLPFQCNDCNKYFTSEADMLRHRMSRKHGVLASLEDKWKRTMEARCSI